jgi:hypothetical protein
MAAILPQRAHFLIGVNAISHIQDLLPVKAVASSFP